MAKILIIEDSPAQASIIEEIVKNAGHEAIVFEEFGKGVHQILEKVEPDLVLLDLVLLGEDGVPVADGFQMCREIKRISDGKVKVVVVSSKTDDESREWALLQGADSFVQKPFVVQELLQEVDRLLGLESEDTD